MCAPCASRPITIRRTSEDLPRPLSPSTMHDGAEIRPVSNQLIGSAHTVPVPSKAFPTGTPTMGVEELATKGYRPQVCRDVPRYHSRWGYRAGSPPPRCFEAVYSGVRSMGEAPIMTRSRSTPMCTASRIMPISSDSLHDRRRRPDTERKTQSEGAVLSSICNANACQLRR